MNSIETTDKLIGILRGNTQLMAALSGGIYDRRPDNSSKEDIVVNCLSYDHGNPATAISNVNIHVPDAYATIGGRKQLVINRNRMRTLTTLTIAAIKAASTPEATLRIITENKLEDTTANTHVNNIRVGWNIAAHE